MAQASEVVTNQASRGEMLIVDDHAATVSLLTELLANAFPGVSIRTAGTAAEAMDICVARMPRVVIMDIGLPDTNGIDTARRIKALSHEVWVVMHSNHDHYFYQQRSAAAGADAFVSKTRTCAELIPAIAKLLESNVQNDPSPHFHFIQTEEST